MDILKKNKEDKYMKYEFTDFDASEQNVITQLRNNGKFVYHLRDAEGDGFTIERIVWVNRIGFLVTDTELKFDEYMTGAEFADLGGEECIGLSNI